MQLYDACRYILTHKLSDRQIAQILGVSKTTIHRWRGIIRAKKYSWEDLSDIKPTQLRKMLLKDNYGPNRKRKPDFSYIHSELEKTGVTLQLLWQEYRGGNPADALAYSQFAALYRKYKKRLPVVMRQTHEPGEKAFVDYSGKRPVYISPTTGERIPVELFVGVLGASSYMFATCTATQQTQDWISAHVDMLGFFGGSPRIIVPDNLKSAVTKTGREPVIQTTYADFARHYDLAIIPARPYRPKDKGKVEISVQIAQRWLVARLRNQTFYSLADLNKAIASLLPEINERPMKRIPGSRKSRFEELDKPVLRSLPAHPYEFAAHIGEQTVPSDYHVPVYGHFYSVPHRLVGKKVGARVTRQTVQLFHDHDCVAEHSLNQEKGKHTTERTHQPEAHRAQGDRTPEAFRAWARSIGPSVLAFVEAQLDRPTPTLGLPTCDTVKRLVSDHGKDIVEWAAEKTLALQMTNLTTLKNVMSSQRQREGGRVPPRTPATARGAGYYAGGAR